MNIIKVVFPETPYYAKDNAGNIRIWAIKGFVESSDGSKQGKLIWSHGTINGDKTENFEIVPMGLASRSIEEQVLMRVDSRINKKLQGGYVTNINDAKENPRRNKLGLRKCMTAKKYRDMIGNIPWEDGVWIQRKYNGFRCMANCNDIVVPYTRNSEIINSIDHITDQLQKFDLSDTLDGELYYHGVPFQTVSSWIKRAQIDSRKLRYMIYDVMIDGCYSERFEYLQNLNIYSDTIILADTSRVTTPDQAIKIRDTFIQQGYEGAMLRPDRVFDKNGKLLTNSKYEDGRRSKYLIKMKVMIDAEFLIIGMKRSAEGWAILECCTPEGQEFTVSAPGMREQKISILENKERYIGNKVRVEFANYTESGKPFHPVAKEIRNIIE